MTFWGAVGLLVLSIAAGCAGAIMHVIVSYVKLGEELQLALIISTALFVFGLLMRLGLFNY